MGRGGWREGRIKLEVKEAYDGVIFANLILAHSMIISYCNGTHAFINVCMKQLTQGMYKKTEKQEEE